MKNLLRLIVLIFILQSCVTSKSALKNFNNAEYNSAAEKYNQIELPKFIQELNNKLETVAFLIVQNDSIAFEKYWHQYKSYKRQWSLFST